MNPDGGYEGEPPLSFSGLLASSPNQTLVRSERMAASHERSLPEIVIRAFIVRRRVDPAPRPRSAPSSPTRSMM